MNLSILITITKIPEAYSEGTYNNRKYGITKSTFNKGKSFKVYGEELRGNDFVSFNYYVTKGENLIKPCEMPKHKVVHFLENVILNHIKKEANEQF
jgi:hypothetical protein